MELGRPVAVEPDELEELDVDIEKIGEVAMPLPPVELVGPAVLELCDIAERDVISGIWTTVDITDTTAIGFLTCQKIKITVSMNNYCLHFRYYLF